MLGFITLSTATWALIGFLSLFLYLVLSGERKGSKLGKAPGPRPIPILGNLLTIAKYEDPSLAFAALAKEFGDVVSVKLGSMDCMVISGMEKIKTILHTQGFMFDARPDFQRYNLIFGHNKDNSVAFSDWSDLQRKRRELIRNHTFPRHFSSLYDRLDSICAAHISKMITEVNQGFKAGQTRQSIHMKPLLVDAVAKIFLEYFTSTVISESNVAEFRIMTQAFDEIFEEVNEGCIGDVIPSLMFACNKSHLTQWGEKIRKFVTKNCVEPRMASRFHSKTSDRTSLKSNRYSDPNMTLARYESLSIIDHDLPQHQSASDLTSMDMNNNSECEESKVPGTKYEDMLESFLNAVAKEENKEDGINLDVALYALEDIIGGHSAISNMVTRVLVLLGRNPEVQEKIRDEVYETVGKDEPVSLHNRMPYTEATIWESVRHISSPIVPHVAVQDTTLNEFSVPKGTVLFINNWDLNFSEKYWQEPEKFVPERFLTEDNNVLKPEHFIPFSTGRRSCMGYKMVQHVTFMFLANFLSTFSIELDPTEAYKMKPGCLALSGDAFKFVIRKLD